MIPNDLLALLQWGRRMQGSPQCRHSGQSHAAIQPRKRRTWGLRWGQTTQRQQDAHGGGYLGAFAGLVGDPGHEQDRAQVGPLAQAVQAATGESVALAYVDQGYTGDDAAQAAQDYGIQWLVVKLPEAKQGFVLLPRRWVVERSFGWPVADAWPVTMNVCRTPLKACLSLPLLCSWLNASSMLWLFVSNVHNTL